MIITGLSTPHAPHFLFSLLRSNHMRCTSGPPHLEGGGGGGGGGGGSGRVLSLSSQSSILSFLFSQSSILSFLVFLVQTSLNTLLLDLWKGYRV